MMISEIIEIYQKFIKRKVIAMESSIVTIIYTNHKRETKEYNVINMSRNKISTGSFDFNKWHKDKQWLLTAKDIDRKVEITFPMKEILAWRTYTP